MIGPSEEKDTMDSVEVSRTLIKEEVHLEETVLPCSGEVSQVAVKDEICDEEPPGNKKDDSFTCSEEDINPVDLVHVKLEADDHEDVENEEDAVEGERQNDAEQHDPGLKVEDSFEVVDEESESESLYEGTEEDAVNIDEMNMPTAAFAEEQEDPLKIDDNGTETETFGEDKGNPSRSDKAKTENFPVALVVNVNALKQNRISGASKEEEVSPEDSEEPVKWYLSPEKADTSSTCSSSKKSVPSQPETEYQPKRKRQKLMDFIPLATKIKIVHMVKEHPKWNLKTIHERGGNALRSKSQLSRWRRDIERGGGDKEKYEQINKWTLDRFREAIKEKKPVTTKMLREWGSEAAAQFKNFQFTASEGWVCKFRSRYKIQE